MPVSAQFEDDNRLVIWTFDGKWTWQEYYSQRDEINTTIESFSHTVDMIVDVTNGSLLPDRVLTHAGNAARRAPKNIGIIVIVGPGVFLRAFFQFFKQMYGIFQRQEQNLHMVGTMEEAYAILRDEEKEKE